MKILGIDSSSLTASVAIVEDQLTVASYTINHKITHSQTLLPMIDEIVRMTETELESVDAIAISRGPGSFTGLRIGSATAKGIGMALSIPLIQVPTLDAMAYQMYAYTGLICPMMDARRNQVYTGLYTYRRSQGSYEFIVVEQQKAVAIEELITQLNLLKQPVVFLGDGVVVHRERLKQHVSVPYDFAPAFLNRANAAALACLAQSYHDKGDMVSARDHTPDYLRVSQAEREQLLKGQNLLIREALFADVECMAKIESEVFSDPWTDLMISETLANPRTINLVAIKDDELVGYLFLYTADGEATIANLAVRESHWGQGIAKTMMNEMERYCKEKQLYDLYLEVRSSNVKARALYEQLGYAEVGLRRDYYESPVEDGVMMCKHMDETRS